jgi:hypothetical protein
MAAEESEMLKTEFWEAVEAHQDAAWKDEEAIAAMTDGVPEAAQHVVEYMVAAYTEEEYEEVERVWENFHQDLLVARMLYGFGSFLAAASSDDDPSPLEVAEAEYYGPGSEADVDGDVDRINEGYDVFDGFDSDGDEADAESPAEESTQDGEDE